MANKIVYPYGTGGELPSSIGIVNDLTTGGADKALSAEMGKELGEQVFPSQETQIDLNEYSEHTYTLGSNGSWYGTGSKHLAINVTEGDTYILVCTSENAEGGFVGWCTSSYSPPASESAIPYVPGTDRIWVNKSPSSSSLVAPTNAAKLILSIVDGAGKSISWQVTQIHKTSVDEKIGVLQDYVINNEEIIIPNTDFSVGYALSAKQSRDDFGSVVTANSNYAVTDYVNCEGKGYSTLKCIICISNATYNYFGLVFFNATKEPIAGYYYTASAAAGEVKTLQIPSGAMYFRTTYWSGDITNGLKVVFTSPRPEDNKKSIDNLNNYLEIPSSEVATSSYIGEKIMLAEHSFGFGFYMDAPKGTGSSTARQGCACYGDILFTFHHTNDMVEVYNMRTKQRIQVITPSGGSSSIHCNCANFSTQFYDSNDPFPLLYISNNGCEVWRITGTEGNYTMTLVQTISGLDGIDTYISQDGTMWTIGWGGGATWDTFVQGGYMRFRQFTIPNISQPVVEVNPDSYIKEVRTAWRNSLQGSFIRGNKLFFLWGQPNNSGIDVIDLGGGRMMSSISLSGGGFTKEPEGIFVWENGLYMTEYPTTNLYRIYV